MRFDFNEIPNGFLVELNYRDQKTSYEKINERINTLTQNERSIMEAIEKNPRITQAQLAANLNLTEQYIRKRIRKLKDAAFIQRIGSNKTGFREIIP
jgi:ATP-dependent DNA helicase RecG